MLVTPNETFDRISTVYEGVEYNFEVFMKLHSVTSDKYILLYGEANDDPDKMVVMASYYEQVGNDIELTQITDENELEFANDVASELKCPSQGEIIV